MIIEQWLLALPQALVYVHTGAIVAKDGFGHECHGLPMLAGCILHDIFVEHDIVGGLQQRIKTDVDLRLPWTADFVMLRLDQHAQFFEGSAISLRMSCSVSLGATGKYPS